MPNREQVSHLEPPDSHHLAQGWIEMGNATEADAELKEISLPITTSYPMCCKSAGRLRAGPDVAFCLDLATALTTLTPERPFGWIHRVLSLVSFSLCSGCSDHHLYYFG